MFRKTHHKSFLGRWSVVIIMMGFGLLLMNSTAYSDDVIKIGSLLPMSGDLAAYGKCVQQGVNLAVKHLNEAGGPQGMTLKVVFRDSQTDPTALRDSAEKLVNVDKVPAIVGPMIRSDVATPVTAPNHVVIISPSNTPTWVTTLDDDDFTF